MALLATAAGPAAAVVIDELTTAQATLLDPPGGATSVSTGGADIVGLRRNLRVDHLDGPGTVSATVAGGQLTVAVAATSPDSRGEAFVSWDGDSDPLVLDPDGLGDLDLTAAGHSAILIRVTSASAGAELLLEVYSDATHMSRAALRLPAVVAATDFHLSYGRDFVPRRGAGADFASVGAIVLQVRGTETTVVIDRLATVGPGLTATKIDLTTGDVPIGANPQPPGGTIKYRVTITNTGGEALAVAVSDVVSDPNLTVDPSTVDATPVAAGDAYHTFGNVAKAVLAASGLLANDVDPDALGAPPEVVVDTSGSPLATALGGSVALAPDGEFTYSPPPGVGGAVDRFDYTAVDNEGNSATATVTIQLGPAIWFVDDVHPGANLGTLDDPFVGITAGNLGGAGGSGDQDDPGDVIYLYPGTYTTGIELEDGQQLLGAGVALVLDGETILPAATAPTLGNAAGNGIVLAMDNTIRGLTVGDTTGTDLAGSNFGTLTVADVTLGGTGGALDLDNGVLAASFLAVGSTNASGRGIDLDTVSGALATAGTTITDSAQAGIRVVGSAASLDFGATTLSSTGSGLELATNSTSTLTFASLAVTTDSGPGLQASNSGTLSIAGAGNSIVANGGAAVDVANTSFGAGATFATVSSSGSPGKGIHLDTVSGSFVASGGSISGAAGVAFDVNAGTATVTYGGAITNAADRAVEVTARSGGAVTLSGAVSDSGTGVNIANNSGGSITLSATLTGTAATSQIDVTGNSGGAIVTFSGASKTLSTEASDAVDVASNAGATVRFSGGGLAITTTSGTGFDATGGATALEVTGSNNTVTSSTGTAIRITGTAIGPGHVSFRSVTSTGASATSAIILANTGAGEFRVTGTGSAGSGGTIDNKSVDAITLDNTDGRVTLAGMIIEDIGDLSGGIDTISNDDAIHGQQVDGGLTLDGVTIRRISDQAVHGATFAGNAATVWNGLTIQASTLEQSNRFHVVGVADSNNEGMVRILGIRGVVTITDSVLQDGGELIDFFVTGGTLTMTATNSDFLRAYKEFTSGPRSSVGGHCIDVTVQGDADAAVTVGNRSNAALGNDFLNCAQASIRVVNDAGATGDIDVVAANNDFVVDDHSSGFGGDFDFPQGGLLIGGLGTDSATFDAVVDGNLFDEVTNASGGVGQLTVAMTNGALQVLVEDNVFDTPGNAPWFLRADSTTSGRVLFRNNLVIKGAFCSPDPAANGGGCNLGAGQLCPGAAGFCGPGLRTLADLQNGAILDLTILGDQFAEHDAGFDPGQTFEARVLPTGGGGTLCLDLQNNQAPDGYSIEEFAGDFNLVGSGTCPVGSPSASCQTLLGNRGNRGGSNVATTNPPFVNVEAGSTIDVVPGACLQPSGPIF